ncbi:hypothetical protein BCR44DRAFT_1066781 [Catenaria anguillulae PL171]|uniref:Uncharacterized protein n=1 Tax=Catenaria anguillulae PL171 TaxID=765915 RepID=A0A1Y2HTN9_9FUNG|nr:hypothetical protein BCR44DRAFT_1066781 [Catenaria anguillulae PL171]
MCTRCNRLPRPIGDNASTKGGNESASEQQVVGRRHGFKAKVALFIIIAACVLTYQSMVSNAIQIAVTLSWPPW